MWWDSAQISTLDSVLFSICTIAILYSVGLGFTKISSLLKVEDPFQSFDFLQKSNFRILYGFVFMVFITVIASFFRLPFYISAVITVLIVSLSFAVLCFRRKLRLPEKLDFKKYALPIMVVVVLFLTVIASSLLITGFYGSTNDDGADHTLMTRIVLDNPDVWTTRSGQPYANFLIRYPLGTHVLTAFFVTTLSVSIQKIVILMSAIFPALIALSFYSTLKCLFKSKILSVLGLVISSFFVIGLFMAPISWGGLPLLLSIYLSIGSIGLFFAFLHKERITWFTAFLLGLIFFVASRTYPVALLMISLWFLLVLIVKVSGVRSIGEVQYSFIRKKSLVFLAFLLPILFAFPYFYSIYTNNFDTVQINLFNTVSTWSDSIKSRIAFNWLFDVPALSSFFSTYGRLLTLVPYSLFLLVAFFIPKVSRWVALILPLGGFRRSLFLVYAFMLLTLGYLTVTLYLPINLMTALFDPARVWQYAFIPGIMLAAVVVFFVLRFVHLVSKRLLQVNQTQINWPRRLSLRKVLAIGLIGLVAVSVGLLSVPVVSEQHEVFNQVRSSFSTYQTLGQNDIALMEWIGSNVPSSELILVSSGDSGQFLAAVTRCRTVSINSRLANYSDLVGMLSYNSSDSNAIPLLMQYNISYVYVGSTATSYALQLPYYRHFNASQFLESPYFFLAQRFGDAWLFEVRQTADN